MTEAFQHDAVLMLEDGSVFRGQAVGHKGISSGEICFNTGMTGYQEIFTDPSYFGQVMVTTHVHIGNYGTIDEDQQSEKVQIAGLICRDFNEEFSRKRADQSIQDYFDKQGIVGIEGIDTREIVRKIRDKGAMNCLISTSELDENLLAERLTETPNMEGLELASQVSTTEVYTLGNDDAAHKIAVLDLGTKRNILNCFVKRDCQVKVFPAKTSYADLAAWNPDGYFLSNGPGDPASMDYAIKTAQQLLEQDKPVFGICLGHQVIALALGMPTYKMHHGHRGINHPVKNLVTGKCEITSQNHGFCVEPEAIKAHDRVDITHINLNDDTIEGLALKDKPVFSVQYHPEAAPGPHDSRYLFDQFVDLLKSSKA